MLSRHHQVALVDEQAALHLCVPVRCSWWELATIVVEVLGRLVEPCTEPVAATPT